MKKTFATLAFAGSDNTLGLSLVCDAITAAFPDAKIVKAETSTAKQADYLLVSLYWWRDIFEFIRFLVLAGIDPRKRAPVIVIGGMAALNPLVLDGYYHFAVLGDGEAAIAGLVREIENGGDPLSVQGVWKGRGEPTTTAYEKELSPKAYIDLRTNKTARVEIARGCRMMCPFCELAHIKPYRELPYEVVRHLIITSKTKTISLFAPDTWSHSAADKIEDACIKAGKNNSGTDVRLDVVRKVKTAKNVRFGVEGFSEKTRKAFRKVSTNKRLVENFLYMANDMKTKNGKRISSATCYMIGDLPGEGATEIQEFWDTLGEIDVGLAEKFTLFLSTSSFCPSPFTPMANEGINPATDFNYVMARTRPRYDKLVIATRGAVIAAPQRMLQLLTVRGDERAARVVFWVATKANALLKSTDNAHGAVVEKACSKAGIDIAALCGNVQPGMAMPWDTIRIGGPGGV